MSNYLRYLLTKQLDVTTDPEKPKKLFAPYYFHHPISSKEGEDNNKKKDIKPHHANQFYNVMMAWMLQGNFLVPSMYNSKSWFV